MKKKTFANPYDEYCFRPVNENYDSKTYIPSHIVEQIRKNNIAYVCEHLLDMKLVKTTDINLYTKKLKPVSCLREEFNAEYKAKQDVDYQSDVYYRNYDFDLELITNLRIVIFKQAVADKDIEALLDKYNDYTYMTQVVLIIPYDKGYKLVSYDKQLEWKGAWKVKLKRLITMALGR